MTVTDGRQATDAGNPPAAPSSYPWDRALRWVDRVQQRVKPIAFVGGVIKKSGEDQVSLLAAVMSHFGMLSIFPLLLLVVTVAGYLFRNDAAAQQALVDAALNNFPVLGTQLRASIQALPGSGLAIVFGSLLLLWASLGFTSVAQLAMAEIWSVPRRLRPGYWPRLGRSIWALAMLGLPTILTGAAAITGVHLEDVTRAMAGVNGWFTAPLGIAAVVATIAVGIGITFASHLLAFRALTPRTVHTRWLLPGAVLFTIFWTVITAFASILLTGRVAHANQLYGTIGFIIGLIFWIYLGAYGALLCSEVNAVRAGHLYPRTLFGLPSTKIDRRALLRRARTEEFFPGQVVEVLFDQQGEPHTLPPSPSPSPPAPPPPKTKDGAAGTVTGSAAGSPGGVNGDGNHHDEPATEIVGSSSAGEPGPGSRDAAKQ